MALEDSPLRLPRARRHVKMHEATSKLQTIGGGIGHPPNAMRVFDYLGLLKRPKLAAGMNVEEAEEAY